LKRNKEKDRKESMSSKSASEIKKSLFKRELRDKEEIKRLLKQLPMKIKI
jgi:hypothetical protein